MTRLADELGRARAPKEFCSLLPLGNGLTPLGIRLSWYGGRSVYVFLGLRHQHARPLLSDPDLVQLLQQSRDKNVRLGVTGMLLYKNGNFIQVLEGPEKNVRDLYLTISKDHRHKGLIVLLQEKIAARWFPDWSMAPLFAATNTSGT